MSIGEKVEHPNGVVLECTKNTDDRLTESMFRHYSQPLGFVGRNICYAILYDGYYYGHIVSGSATRFLPGRNEFLKVDIDMLNGVINNIYFHIEKVCGNYPVRNFAQKVVHAWREITTYDWYNKYGDQVLGFESLVELPRTGELYKRDGWVNVGVTKGYTCKRTSDSGWLRLGTDSYSGRRVWDTHNLRPKIVFVRFP